MKRLFFILSILFFVIFAMTRCDSLKEDEIIARRLMYRVIDVLESRYQLRYIAYSEAGDKNGYKKIGLDFNRFGKMSKDEGRKIIIDCVNVLLNEINSDPKLQPFLIDKPFTINNVRIVIIVFTSEGKDIFYPDIRVFSAFGGKINYSTKSPDHKYNYYTREEETFEEAMRIIEAQNKEKEI